MKNSKTASLLQSFTVKTALFFFCFAVCLSVVNAQFVELTRNEPKGMIENEWVTQVLHNQSTVITAGVDGRVVFRDAASGKLLRETALSAIVLTLSLSKDGQTLAAGDASGTVSLIETKSGKIINSFKADKKIVNASAWSRDGNFLAAGGNDGIVRIWSARDQKISMEINPGHGNIVSLAFADAQLIVGMIDLKERQGSIEVWDWQNNKLVRTFDEGTPAIRALSISPDGKLLAASNFKRSSLLFMMPKGGIVEISLRLLPESDEPTPVAVWDLATGKRLASVEAEIGAGSLSFSPDGKMLACAGSNGAMIFDVAGNTFAEIGRIDSLTPIETIAFSNDSQQLFISRQREPSVRSGEGGTDKLFDPFFINTAMVIKEGAAPTFAFSSKTQSANSLTGGSEIEKWQIRQRNSSPELQTWKAVQARFDDKPDEAKKILQQVIKDSPNYGEAQRLFAVFFESENLKNTQSLLEASVKSDPDCVNCWRTLGDLYFGTRQYTEALKTYQKVLQLKPEYGLIGGRMADSYGNIGLALISAGNNEKNMSAAVEALNQALTLRPGEERFYTNMAVVYYFRGDFDKNISLLLFAQKLRPDHARIYYNLGHAYRYINDKERAIEAYQSYVRLGEKGEEERVERAKEFIRQLSQ